MPELANFRIERLKAEPRCRGAAIGAANSIAGLLDLIALVKPHSVLEIGANRGVSTEAFLLTCAYVTVIDPWEVKAGAEENSYSEFMRRCGVYPHLSVVRGYSPAAVILLEQRFDLAYIDGAHDYESVKKDIDACSKVATWIAGHDYDHPPVFKAVKEAAAVVQIFSDRSWLIDPPNQFLERESVVPS